MSADHQIFFELRLDPGALSDLADGTKVRGWLALGVDFVRVEERDLAEFLSAGFQPHEGLSGRLVVGSESPEAIAGNWAIGACDLRARVVPADPATLGGVLETAARASGRVRVSYRDDSSQPLSDLLSPLEAVAGVLRDPASKVELGFRTSDPARALAACDALAKLGVTRVHGELDPAGLEPGSGVGIERRDVANGLFLGRVLHEGQVISYSIACGDVDYQLRVNSEVRAAIGLGTVGVNVIACPTCTRAKIDVIELTHRVYRRTRSITKPISVAIMGCAVNGPGEASHADLGVAGGTGEGLLYVGGETEKKFKEDDIERVLIARIEEMTGERCLESQK